MTQTMTEGKLLYIAAKIGFQKGHDIYNKTGWDADIVAQLSEARPITKDDIFALTPDGKSIFEFRETWNNLDKVRALLQADGTDIECTDLHRVVKDEKTLIDLAAEHDSAQALFTAEFWVGHADEMEDSWFYVPTGKRSGLNIDKLKSEVAALEGRQTREDRLQELGLNKTQVFDAIKAGNLDEVREKLAAGGDHLRLDDLRLVDGAGDHAFYAKMAWNKFGLVMAALQEHGEIPDAEMFLFKRGKQESIIAKAFFHDEHKQVFAAPLWAGRPDELLKLYNSLKDDQKAKIDIQPLLYEVAEASCMDQFMIDEGVSVESLTRPLYSFGIDGDSEHADTVASVIGLGLQKTWENIEQVRASLQQKGERLSLDDLKRPCGYKGETCLLRAARFGRFDAVLDILHESGETLSLEAFLDKAEGRPSLMDILVETEQLPVILQPHLWVRRTQDLVSLWENIPVAKRNDMKAAFQETHTQANILALQQAAGRKPAVPEIVPVATLLAPTTPVAPA